MESGSRQRIGVFGGTFDPIHLGHLLLAEQAREQLGLSQIRFIPAATSPLKLDQLPRENAKHRLEMVKLAVGGNPSFVVDDRELQRGGASYTVETLRELNQELPNSDLVLLIGSDSLVDFHAWREPEEICKLAFVAVLARGGHPLPDLNLLRPFLPGAASGSLENHYVPMPQIEISSSDLRKRVQMHMSTRYQLHPAVEAYISANDLYLPTASSE